MHRPQRSPFGWLAAFALASCTLTAENFEPTSASPPPFEEGADPVESSSAASAPEGESDVEDSEVVGTGEASPTDVALAPKTPSSETSNAADDAPSCPSMSGTASAGADCCSAPGCSEEAPSEEADEPDVDCGGEPCPCTYGAPEVLGDPNYAGNDLYSPSLSRDGLTLYFGLYVGALPDETIAFSTRPSLADPFGLGNVLPAPINASVEGTPRLSVDGLTLYFSSERPGGLGGRDIYRARRSVDGTSFDDVANLIEINSGATDHLPWVSALGLSMYFSSDRGGDFDIHRTTRATPTDPWPAPEPVAELNTAAVDNGMTVSSDEREIVFASYRLGGGDLFRAVRAPGATTFGAPEYLATVNSDADDTDPALSADGSELYFSSARDGSDSRIWRVSRTCP